MRRILLLVLLATATPAAPDSSLDEAKRRADEGDVAGAVALVFDHLKRTAGDAPAHELAGRWLLELGRLDEAAHQLALAMDVLDASGRERDAARLGSVLARADRFADRRTSLLDALCKDLARAAEKLADSDQAERAETILLRVQEIARGKSRGEVEKLLARLNASRKEVDLDEAAEEGAEGERPLVEIESEHYRVAANLEPEVAELVADTMDDIFRSYVEIYFDGNEKTSLPRATIRIHPTWDAMVSEYAGTASPGLGGWWSPGENRVVCYDTRDRTGSLDEMLDTLFHEASHQFMTRLAGGHVPAWLNEGTSCFFEGAVAMADHRVLWPDAALDRLQALAAAIALPSSTPTLADVVGYEGAGSYPGEYYAFGWGLVYFLQQWEDPQTLAYSFRPLYARYRDEVIRRGTGSRALFDEIFLGEESPLGHATFEDFERDWKRWLLEIVAPLHTSKEETIRERRWQAATRYLDAARAAQGKKRQAIGEEELLERALGQLEMLRRRTPPKGDAGRELLLAQIEVLARLGREQAEAFAIEQLLDLADASALALEPERYAELEKRLGDLDRGNWALRNVRSRARSLEERALALLDDYATDGDALLLRSATFAGACAAALGSEGELAERAQTLRARARERGLLLGRIAALAAPSDAWEHLFTAPPKSFGVEPGRIELGAVVPVALLDPTLVVRGEYELRARLDRGDRKSSGASWAWIVGGTMDDGAVAVGIAEPHAIGVWEVRRRAGAARPKRVALLRFSPPLAPNETPLLAVRVQPSGELEIRVGDREPVHARSPLALPPQRHVGVFVRDATMVLHDPVVELFP